MSSDYQPRKNNPNYLPTAVYRQVLWIIRDYDRMREEYDNLIWESQKSDGQPRGSGIGRPTEQDAIRRAVLWERIAAVEQAIAAIPEEGRTAVVDNILYRIRYPNEFSKNTYSRWRVELIYSVAKKMNLI